MRRFAIKALFLATIVIGILYFGSWLYVHSSAFPVFEQSEREWTTAYHTMPDEIDVAVFGSSHAHLAFRSAPYGDTFFNFALSAQTPKYDLMQMLEFQDRIRPGALVVITVSYPSPFWSEHNEGFERLQGRYYRVLSPEHIVDYDPIDDFLHKYFCLMAEDQATIIKSLLAKDALLASQDGNKQLDVSTIEQQQQAKIDDHLAAIMRCYPETDPVMMESYRQMLKLCKENDWKAVLVTPPYLDEYNDCFPDDFFSTFYEIVGSLSEEYSVPYLNYSHDEWFKDKYSFYRDLDHMNQKGADAFDAVFYERAKKDGIW